MNKTIHYIWLGGKKKPRVINKCIKSWRKFFPDWEIKEWNESNLNIDICEYCREAYDAKKYAFAADVLRFDILYREGGLYFDTDVKVIKSMDDIINNCEAFCGFEFSMINPGLVLYSGEPNDSILGRILENYKGVHFIENGELNTKVVGEYFSEVLSKHGFNYKNEFQVCDSFTVYPSTYFCPTDGYGNKIAYSEETRAVHLYAGSWLPLNKRMINGLKRIVYRFVGLDRIQKAMKVIKRRRV